MVKNKNYDVSLVSVETIDLNLHYGPFSQNWWMAYNEFLVPICLNIQTITILNGHNFILTVVKGNNKYSEQLEYLCNCNSFYNTEPSSSSTNAISIIYQQIFRTKMRISGPLVMGFNRLDVCKKLLEGVLFQPYFINLKLVQIFVFGLARSKNNLWGYAEKHRCLFLQEIEEDTCKNKIFNEQEIKITKLSELTEKILFGIENDITQQKLQVLEILSCSLND
ncbi:43063_t:CDS:2 [Gigaspora margarita]|uniref:43063_t:CDS:1 n=1 Tax=Gigaspora margarita TaxID=4874 RepID=A0ABN7WKZ9_GIGMA|nr:43063_t:CDS:2 [Gigaspora margarita]